MSAPPLSAWLRPSAPREGESNMESPPWFIEVVRLAVPPPAAMELPPPRLIARGDGTRFEPADDCLLLAASFRLRSLGRLPRDLGMGEEEGPPLGCWRWWGEGPRCWGEALPLRWPYGEPLPPPPPLPMSL